MLSEKGSPATNREKIVSKRLRSPAAHWPALRSPVQVGVPESVALSSQGNTPRGCPPTSANATPWSTAVALAAKFSESVRSPSAQTIWLVQPVAEHGWQGLESLLVDGWSAAQSSCSRKHRIRPRDAL